ncbi:MAG: GDP-L-fucose synthase family protein [Chitinophagaceae bacterium]
MKVLITGSRGMVGRNVAETCPHKEYTLLTPSRAELDLLDAKAVRNYMQEHRPDAVIHAAGLVGGIQGNLNRPVDFLIHNFDMGRNVIMTARDMGVTRLINMASSCMYPRDYERPLREEDVLMGELEPSNEGYAIAKIAMTRLCEYIRRENDALQYKTIIPCNLYGRYDKYDLVSSHLVPAAIRKVVDAHANGLDTVEIWGDGMARREFMLASDLAELAWYSLEHINTMPQTLNAGIGVDFTINECYEAIAKAVGYKGRFVHDLNRPVGTKQKLMDVTKLRAFGWTHRHNLDMGIPIAVNYYAELDQSSL